MALAGRCVSLVPPRAPLRGGPMVRDEAGETMAGTAVVLECQRRRTGRNEHRRARGRPACRRLTPERRLPPLPPCTLCGHGDRERRQRRPPRRRARHPHTRRPRRQRRRRARAPRAHPDRLDRPACGLTRGTAPHALNGVLKSTRFLAQCLGDRAVASGRSPQLSRRPGEVVRREAIVAGDIDDEDGGAGETALERGAKLLGLVDADPIGT